jgi:cytochrome P450
MRVLMNMLGNYLSFDIMADVVFGAKYNLLQNERFRYVTESIDKSNIRMSALIQFPKFAALKIDKYLFRDAIVARNRFVKFVMRVVKDRLDKSKTTSIDINCPTSEDADVFANLAAAKDPETGEGFRPDEIAAESTTLIVAGSDTSSTAIASVLFYLADNKDAYSKAAEEVRSKFFSREQIVMGASLASCTYVRACIDESLRMSPPVGSALWREVMPGGTTVDSQAVPAGVDVGVPIYTVHHDPKYYTEPFEYKPERWLVDDGTGSIERGRSVFNPFSVGTRGCLGKGLANTEIMLTVATMLFVGDFRLADGEKGDVGRGQKGATHGRHRSNEYQLYDHVTSQKFGPFLQFSPRQATC